MISEGDAPLWNPVRGAGQPLLANPNMLVLHPTTLLFMALPFESAFKLAIVLQVFLAGAGAWLLLRDIGASRAGSLLGAAVFCFSGYMVSLGNLINLLDSAAFMPLTLWLAGRAMTRGFSPWASLAALSLAVQIMAGEPAILLCTAAAFLGLHWSHAGVPGAGAPASRSLLSGVGVAAGIVLLALAISMVAVLPTVELLARSERGAGFDRDEALKWSLPPVALIQTVVPDLFGDPTRTDIARYWGGGVFDAGLPFILSLYLGPAALILAGAGLAGGLTDAARRRRTEALALAALALGGITLALGRFLPLYPTLLSWLWPLESVRYPVKYFLIVIWAASLLAARGYDAMCARNDARRRWGRNLGWLLLPIFVLLLADGWVGISRAFTAGAIGLPSSLAGAASLEAIKRSVRQASIDAAFVGLMVWVVMFGAFGRLSRLVVFIVTVGPLVWAGVRLNPVAPASFYTEPPTVGRLVDQAGGGVGGGGGGRLWATPRPKGFAYRTPSGMDADSLEAGFRWDRMTLRNATYFPSGYRFAFDRGNERLDVIPGAAIGRALADVEKNPMRPEALSRLLSLASVDRIITYGGLDAPGLSASGRLEGQSNISVVVMKNAAALPRVRIVFDAEVIADMGAALRRLDDPSFDPARVVVLEEDPVSHISPPAAAGDAAEATATVVTDRPDRVVVSTASAHPGYLVLSDTFYPGWKAKVDGSDTLIIRADAMFRAVPVPAGTHEVEFLYKPSSVRSGLMVTAASLLLCALLAVPRRR